MVAHDHILTKGFDITSISTAIHSPASANKELGLPRFPRDQGDKGLKIHTLPITIMLDLAVICNVLTITRSRLS